MVLSDKENKYSPGKVNFGWPISNFTDNINNKGCHQTNQKLN